MFPHSKKYRIGRSDFLRVILPTEIFCFKHYRFIPVASICPVQPFPLGWTTSSTEAVHQLRPNVQHVPSYIFRNVQVSQLWVKLMAEDK